jgi:hypothetical protein
MKFILCGSETRFLWLSRERILRMFRAVWVWGYLDIREGEPYVTGERNTVRVSVESTVGLKCTDCQIERLQNIMQRACVTNLRGGDGIYKFYNFRSSLFCDVTLRRLVVTCRRFGTTYRSHLQESSRPRRTSWSLKMDPHRLSRNVGN